MSATMGNRPGVSPVVPKVKALACPNCGAPVELRGFAHTLSVVCPGCHGILDASTPALKLLQQVQIRERIQPPIPLGSRGKFENTIYEVIGFQTRDLVNEEGYGWSEYVLFNPYKGFRYLSEYRGHWNFIRVQTALPLLAEHTRAPIVIMDDRGYRHFDHAVAATSYVLGEFPWRVRVGETATVDDYVSPPDMLSAETTEGETVWSRGEYFTCAQMWKIFGLPGPPLSAYGVFANQPSPYAGRVGSAWNLWLWLTVALAALAFAFSLLSSGKEVFRQTYSFAPGSSGEPSFVTDVFPLTGRPSNVQIKIDTDLDNNWAYFNFALINEDSGHGYDFGREVSYYHGQDSDGSWREGSPHDSVKIPAIPGGNYYLRVEPEMDAKAVSMHYEILIRRDVLTWTWIWVAAVLLLVPPIFLSIRSITFESARWRESDTAPSGGAD